MEILAEIFTAKAINPSMGLQDYYICSRHLIDDCMGVV